MGAISLAMNNGQIPCAYINEKDISDIGNVVLYGGNGNEAPEIRQIGLNIYNNLTSEGISKQIGNLINKALKESKENKSKGLKDEEKEIIKEQDNTRVGR